MTDDKLRVTDEQTAAAHARARVGDTFARPAVPEALQERLTREGTVEAIEEAANAAAKAYTDHGLSSDPFHAIVMPLRRALSYLAHIDGDVDDMVAAYPAPPNEEWFPCNDPECWVTHYHRGTTFLAASATDATDGQLRADEPTLDDLWAVVAASLAVAEEHKQAIYKSGDGVPGPDALAGIQKHIEAGLAARVMYERLARPFALAASATDEGPDHAEHYDPTCEECVYLARPQMIARPAVSETLDVEAIEADARQRTGHPRFGCIPAWAWRGAILAASATDEGKSWTANVPKPPKAVIHQSVARPAVPEALDE